MAVVKATAITSQQHRNARIHVTQEIKNEILRNYDYNVIIVDWTKNNKGTYPQAVANARLVGAVIAKLTKLLMEFKGLSLQSLHIVGHSLGAHIAGWAGKRLDTVARITGLDPAGPYFMKAPSEVRLDPSDAIFVDVIHTNAGNWLYNGLGTDEALGHLDFYPNGGTTQPGCPKFLPFVEQFTIGINMMADSCDHSRANLLFLSSISNCTFVAERCDSYKMYKMNKCGVPKTVSEMGFRAKMMQGVTSPATFYLKTYKPPFCVGG